MTTPLEKENIIGLLGLGSLPESQKAVVIAQLTDLVQERVAVRLFDLLPKVQHDRLAQALESADAEALELLLKSSKLDLAKLVEEEATAVKGDLVDRMNKNSILK